MKNPFRPSEIVSDPDEFFGRSNEIRQLTRLLRQGSIAIQGSFGVGKSSLLSRALLHLDGFGSDEVSSYKIVVGHGDVTSIDHAARLILEELVEVNSTTRTLTVGIPNVAQYSSTQAYTLFQEGRHLAALNKILEDEAFKDFIDRGGYFVIAIDEVEKCASAIARLFRQVATKSQLNGVNNIRFIFAGVSPFVERMVREDQGVMRFIYETIELKPFELDEAREFLDEKFMEVTRSAEESRIDLRVNPAVIDRIVQLSGGHPHLLQLLGSHVVEHEYSNSDGVIDTDDLVGSLQKICYQKRAPVYESQIHDMRVEGKYESYLKMLEMMGGGFPGSADALEVRKKLGGSDVDWFLARNLIVATTDDDYELVDELLRVRVIMDRYADIEAVELELIAKGELALDGFNWGNDWGEGEEGASE